MTSRAEYYRTARRVATSLGEQPRLRWPRGSQLQWRAERNRLVLLANERRAARRERERIEQERAAELARARANLLQESVQMRGADVVQFMWNVHAYELLGLPIPSPEQFRDILEPTMLPGYRYRFVSGWGHAPVAEGVYVWIGCRMKNWYRIHEVLSRMAAEGHEYGNMLRSGIQMIAEVRENPALAGVRATLTDTNCAIKIVEKYIRTDKNTTAIKRKIAQLNEQYLESGIDNVGLQALANATQMRLVVSDVLGMAWQRFDVLNKHGEPIKGNVSRTIYMLAHNNHVEEEEGSNWEDSAPSNPNDSKEEDVGDTTKLRKFYRDNLDLTGKEVVFHDRESFESVATSLENIDAKSIVSKGSVISLVNATHVHKVRFNECETYPQAFTSGGVGKLKFLAQHPRFQAIPKETTFLRIARDADVSGFYLRTGPSSESNFKYDMNSAYKSFRDSGLFRGFPNLSACYSVNKPFSEFARELTPLSQGLLYIEFPALTLDYINASGKIYFEGSGWYPVELVQDICLSQSVHTDPIVKLYAYASDSFDVDFSGFTNEQFREFMGKCGQTKNTLTWTTTDPIEFTRARFILGEAITHIDVSNQEFDVFGQIIPRTYTVYFTSNKPPWSCPILCAYVKAHQKYNLFKQYNKIISHSPKLIPIYIAVDGIEVDEPIDELFGPEWKKEAVKMFASSNRVIERVPTSIEYLANSRPWVPPRLRSSKLQYIKGSGGTGKTEYILKLGIESDSPVLYLAPTHDACQVLIERGTKMHFDISKHTMTYHRAFGFGCVPFLSLANYKTIVLDECSMVNVEDLTRMLMALNSTQEFVLSGDFGQLNPVSGTPIYNHELQSYHEVFEKFEITELTKNWRQREDPEFFEICQSLRTSMSMEAAESLLARINTRVLPLVQALEPDPIEPDITICGINTQVDAVNALHEMKVGAQVIMTKTTKDSSKNTAANGQIGVLECLKPLTIRFSSSPGDSNGRTSVFPRASSAEALCKLAYAITIHKSQGKTIPGNLAINPTRIFTRNHLYVALTRATRFDRIFLTAPITMDVFMKTCTIN